MLYPKEDKENRILLYAVSAGQPSRPRVRAFPPRSLLAPHACFRLLTTPQDTLSSISSIPSLNHPALPSDRVGELICV